MAQDEQELLIAYLADAGELDPEGDIKAQFQDWYQVREVQVSGEVFYKAVLDSARVMAKEAFEEGRLAGLSEAAAKMGWQELAAVPGLDRFMDHVRQGEG